MRNARIVFVIASAVAVQLAACGGGGSGGGTLGGGGTSSGSTSGGSSSGGTSSSSGGSSSGSTSSSSGATPDGGGVGDGPCAPLIGKWLATLDPGATATGTDTNLTGPIPIAGTINFALTHDDADLPNIVDFNGTANIQSEGQTFTATIAPSTSPSGDTKDTQCNGGLHLKGLVNVAPVGDMIFEIDGTLDTTVKPTTGVGTFIWKTAADDGGGIFATGPLHVVKQ